MFLTLLGVKLLAFPTLILMQLFSLGSMMSLERLRILLQSLTQPLSALLTP